MEAKKTRIKDFWDRVYSQLNLRGSTVSEMTERIGAKVNVLTNCKSLVRYPKVEYLIAISDYLEVSIRYLLTGEDRGNCRAYPDYIRRIADKLSTLNKEEYEYARIAVQGIWMKHIRDLDKSGEFHEENKHIRLFPETPKEDGSL